MEPVETRTVFCWWFREIFGQSWCRIWINCFFLLWWCWSVSLVNLCTAEVSIFWTFNIHVISKTLVHDTLCIAAAKIKDNCLNGLSLRKTVNQFLLLEIQITTALVQAICILSKFLGTSLLYGTEEV